ncbi:MAG TPA: hypothetical protein VM487_03230 [Phycisphaerae bacterium]|nr:hypothetical protein [Planctomycetota bacterium]HUU94726.1 hypothetical protein [Phycisphaerae bacterium]
MTAQGQLDQLAEYFRTEEPIEGEAGDLDNATTVQTAIRLLRERRPQRKPRRGKKLTIADLCQQAHANAVAHGFWPGGMANGSPFATSAFYVIAAIREAIEGDRCGGQAQITGGLTFAQIELQKVIAGRYGQASAFHAQAMLVITEVVEAVLEVDAENADAAGRELADVQIRLGDMAAGFGFDLQQLTIDRLKEISNRPLLHGGKRY